jgi:hypothetical protein
MNLFVLRRPLAAFALVLPFSAAAPSTSTCADEALLKALPSSKHTLAEGIQQVSKGSEAAISAKFEIEDGKLSLSVYTAGKGLGVPAEHNVLQEYAGSPEAAAWKTEVEVFKDVEHVSRSAEQLTLMSLGSTTLADLVKKAEKDHPGTVYSVTPVIRDRKAAVVVLVAEKDKSTELLYDLASGAPLKAVEAGAPKK